jgi:hypothetical protein
MDYIEKLKTEYHKLNRQSKKDALDMAVKMHKNSNILFKRTRPYKSI